MSPMRSAVHAAIGNADFIEIYVQASLGACEDRDPKGLYKKARAGDKEAIIELALLNKLEPHLNAGKTANTLAATPEEVALMKLFQATCHRPKRMEVPLTSWNRRSPLVAT